MSCPSGRRHMIKAADPAELNDAQLAMGQWYSCSGCDDLLLLPNEEHRFLLDA